MLYIESDSIAQDSGHIQMVSVEIVIAFMIAKSYALFHRVLQGWIIINLPASITDSDFNVRYMDENSKVENILSAQATYINQLLTFSVQRYH